MLTFLAKLLKILNSEDSPTPIAWAISLAFLFAILPVFSLFKWLVLVIVAFLRVQLTAFLVFSALFTVVTLLLDPLFNAVGVWLLTQESLQTFWSSVMQTSFGSMLALNNSLALATCVVGIVIVVPLFYLFKILVEKYRTYLKPKVERWHLIQIVKGSKLYQIYQSIS